MASPSESPPIGSKVMDTRVLKEPRGFMRCLEWFFAIIAFATCCDFSTVSEYTVECANGKNFSVPHTISYPFRLDHDKAANVTCLPNETSWEQLAGDFSSDAQFFVFTGVLSFLGTMACLVVYLFFPEMYFSENKKAPMFDFVFTVIVAVFWLSASAAWANGVVGMKFEANPDNWIFSSGSSVCDLADTNKPVKTFVKKCVTVSAGHFAKANVSIILGFLNFFLWASNLWFLYKETSWFSGPPAQTNDQTAASP